MINTYIRTTILYIITFVFFRLMGKRQVGEMQPYELIIALMAADLVVTPMADSGLSLMDGIVPIVTLFSLHNLLAYASLKSEKVRLIFSGRPSVLIENGTINKAELKRLNMNLNDLMENLRVKGTPSLEDICYATLETNGELSVLLNESAAPPTAQDMGIQVSSKGMPLAVILDGKMNAGNMQKVRLSEGKLLAELNASGFGSEKEVFVAMLNACNDLYIQSSDEERPRIITRNIGEAR